DAGEIHVAKWQVAHELVARHDHPGDPEENNFRRGDEVGGRIKLLQRLGLLRPTHRGKRPEPGTEPGVEDVGVLGETVSLKPNADVCVHLRNLNNNFDSVQTVIELGDCRVKLQSSFGIYNSNCLIATFAFEKVFESFLEDLIENVK